MAFKVLHYLTSIVIFRLPAVVKLLENEPQQVENSFRHVLLADLQYLHRFQKFEVNLHKHVVMGWSGKVVPMKEHSKDFEIIRKIHTFFIFFLDYRNGTFQTPQIFLDVETEDSCIPAFQIQLVYLGNVLTCLQLLVLSYQG